MNVTSPLLTDLYQLTMACGYWKLGIHEREAVFHLVFRKYPFKSNYALACGLATVIDFLKHWHFSEEEAAYLQSLKAPDGTLLFPEEFLGYLKNLTFTCDIDAVPEGTLVFPFEPMLVVKGPLLQCQLLESSLLNIMNFQTLIATKASRVYRAAQGEPVLEFGMRRAQGPDGALSASRAAYIGGCVSTSNVLAGKLYDIPVTGTHAHSWVTVFPDEMSAFLAYADVMPHNCILLVDTYDTVNGVRHAIEVGKKLQAEGHQLRGIRLDSGDITRLSKKARILLDEAGFFDTKIIASNTLDEYVITEMKAQGSAVSIWGVGTHLITGYDHPALDGVYKLSALRDDNGKWMYKLKLSEQPIKTSNPGIHQVRRYIRHNQPVMDVIYDREIGAPVRSELFTLHAPFEEKDLEKYDHYVDLLHPIFRQGRLVYYAESIHDIRKHAIAAMMDFVQSQKSEPYVVGLEKRLHVMKQDLIAEVKKANSL